VLESLAYPFYVIDINDYTIKIANSAARLGNPSGNTTCYALSHKSSKPCVGAEHLCPVEEVKKTRQPLVVEHTHYDRDGNIRNVEVHACPIFDNEGNVVQLIEYCLDITGRKRAEEALKSAALETLEALSRLVEANDPYTSGHSAKVTEIAIKIAQEMGLTDDQLDTLRIAGLLHDLGKVGIPGSVLNKPARLTQAERMMVEAHPALSAEIAERVTAFGDAVPVIRHHHEWYDGNGYPDGLKGEEMPLLARILAVADGFEAMTSERPYRRAWTEEKALAELKKGAGSQWDPNVVEAFVKICESGIISQSPQPAPLLFYPLFTSS